MSTSALSKTIVMAMAWTAGAALAQQDPVPQPPEATVAPVDHSRHLPTTPAEPVDPAQDLPAAPADPVDHSQHLPATPADPVDHSQHLPAAPADTTDPVDHAQHRPVMNTDARRDPHAHANGYTLDSGPYLLDSGHRITHADAMTFTGLWMDRLEYVARDGEDATEFEGHVWRGDSYNRILLRTEAAVGNGKVDDAEIDLMLSRAVSPFWDLQFGLRHQIMNDHHRHWAVIGVNGLAPYWLDVDASLFATESGHLFYDLEAEYEMRLTQRLVLQPRIDIHSFNKADEELGHGDGLSKVKLGARLRYEFSRQFAPYLGVERVSSFGETADLLPLDVERNQTWWTAGVKFWF